VGVGVYALLTVIGLAAVFASHPVIYRGVAVIGAVYLFWLGVGALRTRGRSAAGPTGARAGSVAAGRDGFTIALLNPKIALFFAALFSQFVAPDTGLRDTAILALTAFAIDGAWYALVALALSGSGAVVWVQRRRQALDRITGVALIALAGWALTQAFAASV
jgi:threonine/homoserine/homoserine lactone efflux protein